MPKKKIILHIDFNSFFASVEQQANPFLRGKAIAVGGKGRGVSLERTVVTTASREAKALGIKTAMASVKAKQQVPGLIMVQGDPRKYSEITKRFLNILKRYADAVEQFSTDEAFADLTHAAGDYFGATMIAQMIRQDIKRECGEYCTASIGIAPNKLVAKLASESQKPNGLTVVNPRQVPSFMKKQELGAICGIGFKMEEHLANMGITTIEALQSVPEYELEKRFKSYGRWLYAAARGRGDDNVSDVTVPPKSIGHSYTFPHDLETAVKIQTNLLALCDKVASRMRRDNFCAKRVHVYVRYQGFGSNGAQVKINEHITDGLEIFKNAWHILSKIKDPEKAVRLIGVSVSALQKQYGLQQLMPKQNKMNATLQALDKLQKRYGKKSWKRAATMNTLFLERTSGWHYDHEV